MQQESHPELLIVLGKNIGVGSTPADIRRSQWHLSAESRMNVIAAGQLYEPGMHILFSGGQTAGNDVPAESHAMRSYLGQLFPGVPGRDVLVEDRSYDTAGNAEEVAKMLATLPYRCIGLLSVGYHVDNAATLFRRHGVPIDKRYASDEIMGRRSPHHEAYAEAWTDLKRIRQERKKEMVRTLLLHTIDPRGKMLQRIAQRSRR